MASIAMEISPPISISMPLVESITSISEPSLKTMNHQAEKDSNRLKDQSKSAPFVEQIRQRFLTEEWEINPEEYCEKDIERVKQSKWYVKRFYLSANRNCDEAFELLRSVLKWRRQHDLSNVRPEFFPREFYEIGGLFEYEPDRQGNPVIYLRIRMHRKIKEIQEPIQQFLLYTIDRVDRRSDSKGCVIVFDCSGAGYSNMDLDMLKSLIDIAFKYFPLCIRHVIVYELSWMLNAFRKIAMNLVPSSLAALVRFANQNDITDFIQKESLPDFMGGTCRRNYRQIPSGCRSTLDMAIEHGFTREQAENIMKQFEPFLKEAREANERIENLFDEQENDTNNNETDENDDDGDARRSASIQKATISSQQIERQSAIEDRQGSNSLNQRVERTSLSDASESIQSMRFLDKNECDRVISSNLPPTKQSTKVLVQQQEHKINQQRNQQQNHLANHNGIASIYPQKVIHFNRIPFVSESNNRSKSKSVLYSSHLKNSIAAKNEELQQAPEMENFFYTATFMIQNNQPNRLLAFKIKSNNSRRYSVTPNQGVLDTGSYVIIRIIDVGINPNENRSISIQDKFLILLASLAKSTNDNDVNDARNRAKSSQSEGKISEKNSKIDIGSNYHSIGIDSMMHLKNPKEFDQLFVRGPNGGQIFQHRLIASNENKSYAIVERKHIEQSKQIVTLQKELDLLRNDYLRMEQNQKIWTRTFLVLMLIFGIFIMIQPFHNGFERLSD
ncbi:Motile sperm domain-containing protein 2 [Sarcoptes scabiei]|uniref:Motile sperm domain-containing protein 2 n=1 Tax=Sarcoptes scabiei TaxID=52283 RepID=A0A834RCF0_SARSC|nr:Motile sperm domain-containing protein 2 [Sarcoptes scabiei]